MIVVNTMVHMMHAADMMLLIHYEFLSSMGACVPRRLMTHDFPRGKTLGCSFFDIFSAVTHARSVALTCFDVSFASLARK